MQIRPYPPAATGADGTPAAPASRSAPGFAAFLQSARTDTAARDAALEAEFKEWTASLSDRGLGQGRLDNIEANAEVFLDLLKLATRDKGLADPRGFLQSLSTSELAAVQAVQGVSTDDLGSLSDEGAMNLLVTPGSEVDLDQDGMITKGKIRLFSFPPPGAPDDVKAAWKEAVEGMDQAAQAMAQSLLWLSGWGSYGTMQDKHATADYRALAQSAIGALEESKLHQSMEQRAVSDRNIAAFQRFLDRLA